MSRWVLKKIVRKEGEVAFFMQENGFKMGDKCWAEEKYGINQERSYEWVVSSLNKIKKWWMEKQCRFLAGTTGLNYGARGKFLRENNFLVNWLSIWW